MGTCKGASRGDAATIGKNAGSCIRGGGVISMTCAASDRGIKAITAPTAIHLNKLASKNISPLCRRTLAPVELSFPQSLHSAWRRKRLSRLRRKTKLDAISEARAWTRSPLSSLVCADGVRPQMLSLAKHERDRPRDDCRLGHPASRER